jgi:hypothetical protein
VPTKYGTIKALKSTNPTMIMPINPTYRKSRRVATSSDEIALDEKGELPYLGIIAGVFTLNLLIIFWVYAA